MVKTRPLNSLKGVGDFLNMSYGDFYCFCRAFRQAILTVSKETVAVQCSFKAFKMPAISELEAFSKHHGLFRAATGRDVTCNLLFGRAKFQLQQVVKTNL